MADDVLFVAGSGANRATLVIDFNDGKTNESFAWGYRWDGVASGADMFLAITVADPSLSAVTFGSGAAGFFLTTISYLDGTDSHSESSGNFAVFPDDYFSWGYYAAGGFAGDDTPGPGGSPLPVAGGGNALPASWTSSPVGASLDSFGESGRILSDGAWDAWSFGANDASFLHLAEPGPEMPAAAIPEPATAGLLVLAFGCLLRRRLSRGDRGRP